MIKIPKWWYQYELPPQALENRIPGGRKLKTVLLVFLLLLVGLVFFVVIGQAWIIYH